MSCLVALNLVVLVLPRPAIAHSAVNSVHSVAFDATGTTLLTVSFGVVRRAPGLAPTWLCPAAFGADKPALNRVVVAHDGAFFLLSNGGVLRSPTGACPWTAIPSTGTAKQLSSADGGLWLRSDVDGTSTLARYDGAGWAPRPLPAGIELSGIQAGPGAKHIWAAGRQGADGAVWLSDDDGAHWVTRELPKAEFAETTFTPLAGHPSRAEQLVVRAASALNVDRLLRSSDAGVTWTVALAPSAGVDLSSAVWLADATTGTLVVGSEAVGLWRDDGAGLVKIVGGPRVGCLARHAAAVYACTDEFAWGASLLRISVAGLAAGAAWQPAFCFAEISGADACAPACAAGWSDVVAGHGIQSGKACGLNTATPVDGGATQDTATVGDAATSSGDAATGPTTGPVLAAKPNATGCQGRPSTPVSSPVPLAAAVLLLLGLRWAQRRRTRP